MSGRHARAHTHCRSLRPSRRPSVYHQHCRFLLRVPWLSNSLSLSSSSPPPFAPCSLAPSIVTASAHAIPHAPSSHPTPSLRINVDFFAAIQLRCRSVQARLGVRAASDSELPVPGSSDNAAARADLSRHPLSRDPTPLRVTAADAATVHRRGCGASKSHGGGARRGMAATRRRI